MRKKRGRKVNSRFRLAAADMDGTLLNQERKITKRTQEVIKQVIEQGVYFVPATGRAVNALPVELRSIKGVRYGIFSNGGTVYDLQEERTVYTNHFDPKRALELIRQLRPFDLMISVSQGGQSYGERIPMEHLDYYELDENTREIVRGSRKIVENIEDHIRENRDTIEKMTLIFRTMEERARVWDWLRQFEDIQYSSSLPKNIEISKKGCNKGTGLLHLAEILGVEKDEIIVFGDADNDREMFEQAGCSVAMANGLEEMKAMADYVTASNREDGAAKAMEKLILGKAV
mgnify:FL=1